MRKKLRRTKVLFALAIFLSGILPMVRPVQAVNIAPGAVVINEVAWAGTVASASDEWIELYNTTDQPVDLSGWLIDDDNGDQVYSLPNGAVVAANSYFLIEDSEATTSVNADAIVNLSLNNIGDTLVLKDAAGNVMDTVNAGGGAWYAGNAAAKTSMEKIDVLNKNDVAANWAGNTKSSGATDSAGNVINGTPRAQNSVAIIAPNVQKATVELVPDSNTPSKGAELKIQVNSHDVVDLFSYGFDVGYNPDVLEYVSANKDAFLGENGTIETSFNAGLENNVSGKLVVAEARLGENKTGVSGDGTLFNITFNVIGDAGENSDITVGNTSFLANTSDDLIAEFSDTSVSVEIKVTNPVQNLAAAEGPNRYEIAVVWQAPVDGAETYKILRKNTAGNFVEIGQSNVLSFVDSDLAQNGGKIIPNIMYDYKVVAIKNGVASVEIATSQKDTRGIKGDNNRSDRVDGRDLERLAQHFAETSADAAFDKLVDTTYDGQINGNDLIDISANWALTYTE